MYWRARLLQLKASRWKQLVQPRNPSLLQPRSQQHWMSTSSTVAGSKGDTLQDEEVQKWGWSMKIAATLLVITCGVKIGPDLAETLVRHSVKLVGMKDPFFQRSGAYRLSLIAMDEKRRQAIVKAGATPLLVALLDPAGDPRTNAAVVSALASLAQSETGVDALRETEVEPLLSELGTTSTDPKLCQDVNFLLGKLEESKSLPAKEGSGNSEAK